MTMALQKRYDRPTRSKCALGIILSVAALSGCDRSSTSDVETPARDTRRLEPDPSSPEGPRQAITGGDSIADAGGGEELRGSLQSGDRAARASKSPSDTIRLVHEYRLAGRLALLEEHLVPEQRPQVVELIQAVDRLLWGNGVLKAAVTQHFGPSLARAFDRSQAANVIGVFSRDLTVLDETVDGNTAVVTLQIADRIPLDKVQLVRREGRWLIRTDPPIPGVSGEIRRLAEVLIDVSRMIADKDLTPIQLKKELALRERAVGRRITALIGEP